MSTALEGTVQYIRYANPDSGWAVAGLKVKGTLRPVPIVGAMPGLAEGMEVRLTGGWEETQKYGRQFKAEHYTELVPATEEGLAGYLASGFVPGIGAKMGERIVAKFGTEALDVIMHAPERLTEVSGLGNKRATALVDAVKKRRGHHETLVFLFGLGISRSLANRIYKRYGDDAVALVRHAPYRLAEEVHGVGFFSADRVARGLNIAHDDLGRLRAGVYHCLRVARDDGHCYVLRRALVATAAELLEVPPEAVDPAVSALAVDGRVTLSPGPIRDDDDAVYLTPLYDAEERVASHLADMIRAPGAASAVTPADVDAAAAILGIALAEGQRAAVLRALSGRLVIITGGPGTGKTTIVRTILEASDLDPRRVALAAPTGRAAKRLSETTGRTASTIHRLLEFSPMEARFQRDEADPLDLDLVIVDEASMIDLPLFYALVRAIPATARLVLVGDKDQLPPVGPGCPLTDLIDSEAVPVARLTEIFRQGKGSAIVESAHTVNAGDALEPTPAGTPLQDFYFIAREDPDAVCATIEQLVTDRIPSRFGLDPVRDVQVLTPMRTGPIGVDRLNERLQALLNPPPATLEDKRAERLRFRVGDKVMQLRNDYDRGVFNGDLGFVTRVDTKGMTLHVAVDDREVVYDKDAVDDLVLAYAVTVHKSQGSEYPAVVMPVSTHHFKMLRRNLIYTGITRGKRLVVLVGTARAMRIAAKTSGVTARATRLGERLRQALSAEHGIFAT